MLSFCVYMHILKIYNMFTVMILSFRTGMPGQTVLLSLILVYTICHSVCIVWTHYSMVEQHSSNFRVITTNVLGVRIFRKLTVNHCFGKVFRILRLCHCYFIRQRRLFQTISKFELTASSLLILFSLINLLLALF